MPLIFLIPKKGGCTKHPILLLCVYNQLGVTVRFSIIDVGAYCTLVLNENPKGGIFDDCKYGLFF